MSALPGVRRHGLDGWRAGCRCRRCRAAHTRDTREMRREWSWIDQSTWHAILLAIRRGRPPGEAAERYGITLAALYAQGQVYPDRGEQLDAALTHGRDPDLPHGRYTAVRAGCACPECRASRRRWR